MRKVIAIALVFCTALAFGQGGFYSENVTAGASGAAVPTLSNWNLAERVRVSVSSADVSYVRFAPDLLPNADFENFTTSAAENPTGYPDMWDASSNLIGWGFRENTVTVELYTTSPIYDNASLSFDVGSTSELVANQDYELVAGDDFTSWTEAVNAGSGTITSIETGMYDGAEAAELTGGSAHVDLTSATITVTASTAYVLSVWGQVDNSNDEIDVRVKEATGGTDFLQADGTWGAAEVDFCESTFDDSTSVYQQCVVEFTTDTGITGITVSVHADVSGDVGQIDAWSLTAKDTSVDIQATSRGNINDTTADSYVCGFTQLGADGADGSSRVEYAIIDPTDSDTSTNGVQIRYYTGSAWTTTETWISSAYAATATQTLAYFEARAATGHPVQFRIRPEVVGQSDEDIYIDKAFCVATARAGKGVLLAAAGDSFEFLVPYPGRFTAIRTSSQTVNFAQVE